MALVFVMWSIKNVDSFNEELLIADHQRRMLDWDFVHIAYCREQQMYPSKIAERVGMETSDVRAILDAALDQLSSVCDDVTQGDVL